MIRRLVIRVLHRLGIITGLEAELYTRWTRR